MANDAVGQLGDRGRIEVGDLGVLEGAPGVAAFRRRAGRSSPPACPAAAQYSSLIATMRPSASAVSASTPPLAGWRRDVGGPVDRHRRRRERRIAPHAVMPLEGDQPRAVGQARHALGVGFGLARRAACRRGRAAEPIRPSLEPARLPVGVVVDRGGEPGALVGDRGEGLAVGRDMEVRPAAEMARIGRHRDAAAPDQLADAAFAAGSSSLSSSARARISSAVLRRPAGGGGRRRRRRPAGRATRRERRARAMVRPSSRPAAQAAMRRRVQAARRPDCRRRPGATLGRGRRGRLLGLFLVEQRGELLHHRAAELVGVDDGDGAAVVARDVVADADGDQLDRRARLDPVDDVAQVALEIVAGIDRQRRIVDRRAVGDHHQDLALLGARQQAVVRPQQRLAVDVLLEDALAQHQAEVLARPPPRRVGRLVDDVAQVVEAARDWPACRRRATARGSGRPSRRGW